jgi:hypothetical protein
MNYKDSWNANHLPVMLAHKNLVLYRVHQQLQTRLPEREGMKDSLVLPPYGPAARRDIKASQAGL